MNEEIKKEIENHIKDNRVVLYMKGTPEMPQCGFSAAVVQAISRHGKPFKAFNVLENETLRQGIKEFSNWPTIPQIYINGEFIGGCDIIMDLDKRGELGKML